MTFFFYLKLSFPYWCLVFFKWSFTSTCTYFYPPPPISLMWGHTVFSFTLLFFKLTYIKDNRMHAQRNFCCNLRVIGRYFFFQNWWPQPIIRIDLFMFFFQLGVGGGFIMCEIKTCVLFHTFLLMQQCTAPKIQHQFPFVGYFSPWRPNPSSLHWIWLI